MTNLSKCKLLSMTVVLTMLLLSSAYAALIPKVDAAELPIEGIESISLPEMNVTLSAIEEKGLTILNNVVGLDVASYTTTSKETPQTLYLDVIPQENVRYVLQSADSKVDMLYTFVDGNLRKISVLESKGTQHLKITDEIEAAEDFLNDYQSYSGKAFYGELGSMLNKVEAGKNFTEVSGNVRLEVTNLGSSETFRWTYLSNGFEAPNKCVALRYKDGFLKYFVDTWALHKIGSSSVNISEDEAIEIAMKRAETFSWKMGSDNALVEIKNFTVGNGMIWEAGFRSSLVADKSRSEDALMLYPMYHVWVSLDKFYPGNVYGFDVYVWADIGEVCYINERVCTLDPPEDLVATHDKYVVEPLDGTLSSDEAKLNSVDLEWLMFPAFATIMLSIVLTWFLVSKEKVVAESLLQGWRCAALPFAFFCINGSSLFC